MAITQKEADIQMMLAASCHLGTKNCDHQMERYVYRRRQDGLYVFNLGKTWEKLELAARVICAIENPEDIAVISARPYGQRAVLKFAQYTGSKTLPGRHTPGASPPPALSCFLRVSRAVPSLARADSTTRRLTRPASLLPFFFTRTLRYLHESDH